MVGDIGEPPTQQRLHNDSRNLTLGQLVIQILCLEVAARSMFPVHIIQLYLYKVPMNFTTVMHLQGIVIDFDISVERPSQTADASCFTLLDKKINHTVVYVAFAELLHATATNHV